MEMAEVNIKVKQGATWSRTVTLKTAGGVAVPIEDGWLGRAQIRSAYNGPLVATFVAEILDYAGGVFKLTLPARALEGQTYVRKTKAFWDIELYDPDDPDRVASPMGGEVLITPEVTKTS